jgi:hypothetical protein
MYCPKCGIQNNDQTKFCRDCGENLKVISQAMSRRLPVILASKMDAYLERKNERLRRDSILSAVNGCLFLFLGVRGLITEGGGSWFGGSWFPIVFGCFMLLWSLWDYMVYKRSLSLDLEKTKTMRVSSTHELESPDSAQGPSIPPGITESTTKHLDTAARVQEKS